MTSIKFRALTHDDHKLFFEALGEHGKDFQNIQQYMVQKGGGKSNNKTSNSTTTSSSTSATVPTSTTSSSGATSSSDQNSNNVNATNGNRATASTSSTSTSSDPQLQDKKEEDKKREQIRNFYNKLYTKLSQLVGKLDDRVEKVNQELYLLINYGEIWKKHGFKFNNKTKKLLEDLIAHGYTTLRFKNKNVRLRTPPCKALKKINRIGIDEKVKVVSARELPKDVTVEFHPATNRDWLKVQSLSQNPRVRAKLSIQKRIFSILDFLESKWDILPEKLNKTVDAWLKLPPMNISQSNPSDDFQHQNPPSNNTSFHTYDHQNGNPGSNGIIIAELSAERHFRIRLKPSALHELKEVNITRVVPDNHLDLSMTAYINRLVEANSKKATCDQSIIMTKNTQHAQGGHNVTNNIMMNHSNTHTNAMQDGMIDNQLELSQGAMSSTSNRLAVSLTTPDCSILLERSSTSDQPSIAQARRQLNLLQTLAGSFEGCENSRTACEETQDRLIQISSQQNPPDLSQKCNSGFGGRSVTFADVESNKPSMITSSDSNIVVNNNIPALFDENAAIDLTNVTQQSSNHGGGSVTNPSQHSSIDCHNSKSVDFNIPKNLTLGDWFKMADGPAGGGDDANHAFSQNDVNNTTNSDKNSDTDRDEKVSANNSAEDGLLDNKESSNKKCGLTMQPHNHMIEIEKMAEGWTRQDESSMTIGELYLAFKCPKKIVLEYEFEQFTYSTHNQQSASVNYDQPLESQRKINIIRESPSNDPLIFKLLTAASLSLAHIEHQRQEQQNKLQKDQPNSKLKRRKGGSTNPNSNKYLSMHDIEATNQRVEEALKQLQPTRLSFNRRAR